MESVEIGFFTNFSGSSVTSMTLANQCELRLEPAIALHMSTCYATLSVVAQRHRSYLQCLHDTHYLRHYLQCPPRCSSRPRLSRFLIGWPFDLGSSRSPGRTDLTRRRLRFWAA